MLNGELIRTLRKEKALTQQALADKLAITKQAVSLYELGTMVPQPKVLVKLAKILGVKPDALNDTSGRMTNKEVKKSQVQKIVPEKAVFIKESDPSRFNDRIEEIIKTLGLNQKEFALQIGEEPNTISHILKRRIGVSTKVISAIMNNIKGVNSEWLLSGVGPMFFENMRALPFYEVDVTAGNVGRIFDGLEVPKETIIVPGFADCDFAVPVSGHSMYPKISNGDIIICKQITDLGVIEYGQIYLIVTDERRMVKYIRKAPKNDSLLLVSENKDRFDPFEIPREKVRRLFLVKGWVNKNEI